MSGHKPGTLYHVKARVSYDALITVQADSKRDAECKVMSWQGEAIMTDAYNVNVVAVKELD